MLGLLMMIIMDNDINTLIMIDMVRFIEGHLPKASVISMRKKSAAQTYKYRCKYKYKYTIQIQPQMQIQNTNTQYSNSDGRSVTASGYMMGMQIQV